ncbi:MAG TPA: Uma2 family endonuclease [Candidatus Fraserbacteria bacterium]|nr:Uma2 family endonuclease [Candidatus Fraserbacteria bacterium]
MVTRVMVVDERKELLREPYVVHLGGWSLERYLQEAPDHLIWEFVRGEVVMHSPATAEHQELVGFLYRLMAGYCEDRNWGKILTGPAAVQILPEVVREPDLFVLPPEAVSRAKGTPLKVRPALVVEVISPSTRTIDLKEKVEEYALARIPEYWAVDSEKRELLAHRLAGARFQREHLSRGRVESRAVPGLWLDVGWLFQEPLPPAAGCLRELLESSVKG